MLLLFREFSKNQSTSLLARLYSTLLGSYMFSGHAISHVHFPCHVAIQLATLIINPRARPSSVISLLMGFVHAGISAVPNIEVVNPACLCFQQTKRTVSPGCTSIDSGS